MTEQAYLSHSPEETLAIGRALGRSLAQAAAATTCVALLEGELGAGKTRFVKGLAAALGIAPEEVTSPTFALVQAHAFQGGTLWHVDLYRLPTGSPSIADAIALEDMLDQPGIIAIEWPERLGKALDGLMSARRAVWRIQMEEAGENARRITIRPPADQPIET